MNNIIIAFVPCPPGQSCPPSTSTLPGSNFIPPPDLIQTIFGKIQPPDALKTFIGNDPTGAGGLSRFLTNIIALFYSLAAVVLIFMIIWGAWDWLTSEGDKEKLDNARKKLINAFIGIALFAAAFAIIKVLGQFTGFTFFKGQ